MKTAALILALAFYGSATFADGAADYKSNCALCHGPDGSGKTPTGKALKVKDLSSPEVQAMTDAELTTIIADGKGKMPAFKTKIDAARIAELVALIRSMKK